MSSTTIIRNMAYVCFDRTDNGEVYIQPTDVQAVASDGPEVTTIHLQSGVRFNVKGQMNAVMQTIYEATKLGNEIGLDALVRVIQDEIEIASQRKGLN